MHTIHTLSSANNAHCGGYGKCLLPRCTYKIIASDLLLKPRIPRTLSCQIISPFLVSIPYNYKYIKSRINIKCMV